MAKAIIPTAPQSVQEAAAAYRAAVQAVSDAETVKRKAAAILLQTMAEAALTVARTLSGTVTVSEGRETIAIICPALQAEIEAIRQRSVRTGRGELRKGAPFVTLRK